MVFQGFLGFFFGFRGFSRGFLWVSRIFIWFSRVVLWFSGGFAKTKTPKMFPKTCGPRWGFLFRPKAKEHRTSAELLHTSFEEKTGTYGFWFLFPLVRAHQKKHIKAEPVACSRWASREICMMSCSGSS